MSPMGSWSDLRFQACISSYGVGLKVNKKAIGSPPTFVTLWAHLAKLVIIVALRVYTSACIGHCMCLNMCLYLCVYMFAG